MPSSNRSDRTTQTAGPSARLFVALDLEDSARNDLAQWRDRVIAGRDDLRPVATQALHLTLCFLGNRPESDIERLSQLIAEAASPLDAFELQSRAIVAVPPRRPRLFALDLADPASRAGQLQQAVSDALEAEGFYTPEKRPFWPHVTLARVKRGARATALEGQVLEQPLVTDRVTLYRSTLARTGARYEALATTKPGG